MKIDITRFAVSKGEHVRLDAAPTKVDPLYGTKQEYGQARARHVEQLGDLQRLLYAANRYALLVIFQGMDAAGKDGAIRHVMSGINPQGCDVYAFKAPNNEEVQHDFLWREH